MSRDNVRPNLLKSLPTLGFFEINFLSVQKKKTFLFREPPLLSIVTIPRDNVIVYQLNLLESLPDLRIFEINFVVAEKKSFPSKCPLPVPMESRDNIFVCLNLLKSLPAPSSFEINFLVADKKKSFPSRGPPIPTQSGRRHETMLLFAN